MIVRVNPHCRRREGLAGYDPDGLYLRNMDLNVLAMIHANQTKAYLVCYSIPGVPCAIEWLKEQHVEVISKEKPSNWIEKNGHGGVSSIRPIKNMTIRFHTMQVLQ